MVLSAVRAVDYVFVVDTSGSMRERVSRQNPTVKITVVQNHLRQHLLALPSDSRLTLISFNTGLKDQREVVLRSDADRQAVLEWVNGLERETRAHGSTHLWAALRRGLSVASE
jgi:Mg-chelatase subunit ChlD